MDCIALPSPPQATSTTMGLEPVSLHDESDTQIKFCWIYKYFSSSHHKIVMQSFVIAQEQLSSAHRHPASLYIEGLLWDSCSGISEAGFTSLLLVCCLPVSACWYQCRYWTCPSDSYHDHNTPSLVTIRKLWWGGILEMRWHSWVLTAGSWVGRESRHVRGPGVLLSLGLRVGA